MCPDTQTARETSVVIDARFASGFIVYQHYSDRSRCIVGQSEGCHATTGYRLAVYLYVRTCKKKSQIYRVVATH